MSKDYLIFYYYYYIIKYSEPEKTTGTSGVIPIAVLKEESYVEIVVSCI